MRAVFDSPFTHTDHEFVVLFSRERRCFWITNGEPDARMFFDGSAVTKYEGGNSAVIRDLDTGTSDYLFDPRLLGITTSYSWSETVSQAVPCQTAARLDLVGQEEIRGNLAWHVYGLMRAGWEFHFWIDDRNGFRVYRYSEQATNGDCASAESFYEHGSYPYLPSRIEGVASNAVGRLRYKRQILISNGEANVRIPATTWTLAGLRLPPETSVVDLRIQRRLGYWDGKRLVAEGSVAARPSVTAPRLVVLIAMGALFVVPAVLLWRVRRKKNL